MTGIVFRICMLQEFQQDLLQFMSNRIAEFNSMSDNDSGFNKDNPILVNSTHGRVQLDIQFLMARSLHIAPPNKPRR